MLKRSKLPNEEPDVENHINTISLCLNFNIGIKHGFPCINVCQVPREMLKTEAVDVENRGRRPRFSTSPEGPGKR